jgi:hypothetical protein
MLYRGIITFLIIIRAAPSAALRVLSFSWTISYRVGLSASIPLSTRIVLSAVRPLPLPEVWYRRYLYGPLSLSLSLSLCAYTHTHTYVRFVLLFRLDSTHYKHRVSNNFHLNYLFEFLCSTHTRNFHAYKKHACSCPVSWIFGDF